MNPKVKLCFADRVGIVADISSRIVSYGCNIVAMEVVRSHDAAHIYIELENTPEELANDALLDVFHDIPGLFKSHFIDALPRQESENRFRVLLDNITHGVISVDRQGIITTINRNARNALGFEMVDVIGRPIESLNLPQNPILDCLRESSSKTVKQDVLTPKGRLQYISTCKLIRDDNRNIIGAVEIAKDVREIKKLASCLSDPDRISFTDIIGEHEAIREAIDYAKKIAQSDAVVSIIGGSGTGKELFARAIHTHSGRPGPFVAVNCAALPEQLLESELFGYVGGSFTGGKRGGSAGLFETAKNGTIFLDEIAEMPLSAQAKLLRSIQEHAVRRIGGAEEIPINARLITATNKNLEQLVEEKRFRQDLYYRICVLPIHIPPLKARIDDIPLLVEHFLFQVSNKLGSSLGELTPQALKKLQTHDWPGNVRELKNVIDRAAILCDCDNIDVDCILLSHELSRSNHNIAHLSKSSFSNSLSLKERLADLERELILKALKSTSSIRQAAKKLQISHPALIKKKQKYNLMNL